MIVVQFEMIQIKVVLTVPCSSGPMTIDLETAVRTLVCVAMGQHPSKRVAVSLIVAVLAGTLRLGGRRPQLQAAAHAAVGALGAGRSRGGGLGGGLGGGAAQGAGAGPSIAAPQGDRLRWRPLPNGREQGTGGLPSPDMSCARSGLTTMVTTTATGYREPAREDGPGVRAVSMRCLGGDSQRAVGEAQREKTPSLRRVALQGGSQRC